MKENKFEYMVMEEDGVFTIKELLKRKYGFSSRLLSKLKVGGGVNLNGSPIKMYEKARVGDKLTVCLPQESSNFQPEDIPISVVYEDDDLLVINKQPGFVVHPTKGHPCHTIANGIMKYMIENNKSFKIRFINRLDMDTSGLLIIAKNSHCQDDFSKQMERNGVVKKYKAVVKGIITEDKGTIDFPIDKIQEDLVKRGVVEGGYPSVTHYQVLERFSKGYSLVELSIETGRTHQIRVHMSHIGHPVVGDALYGEETVWLIERQALHAGHLSFKHPVTRQSMSLDAPLPKDMEELLGKIK